VTQIAGVRRQARWRCAGKTPFVAAVETTDEGKPVRLKLRRSPAFVQHRSTGSPSAASIQTAPNFKASVLRGAKGSSGPNWNIKHKLKQVTLERDATKRLTGRVEIDDAYLGGERNEASAAGRKRCWRCLLLLTGARWLAWPRTGRAAQS
jgi:hypothetical protein